METETMSTDTSTHETLADDHKLLQTLARENNKLLKENNRLLRKLTKYNAITFWLRIVWYALLIGLPFALYFYLLEPYFTAFGSSYENFIDGLNELPGLKGIKEIFGRE